jgi:organic anion transporter 4C
MTTISNTIFVCTAAKHVRETRISETHDNGEDKKLDGTLSISKFPVLLCRLLKNPAFMCVAFAGAFMGLVTISMATFLPKYIQNIYGTTASAAATYAGNIYIFTLPKWLNEKHNYF